jgi:hypothetical protein
MKRTAIVFVTAQLFAIDGVSAQSAEEMLVAVSAHMTRTTGAEEAPGMFLTTGALNRQTAGSGRFSVRPCGALTLAGRAEGPFEEGATAGWRVQIVPVRVRDDGAATFRLKWTRALDASGERRPAHGDVELTMRPGESRPIDAVVIPPDKQTGRRCTVWDNRGTKAEYSSVALRVSVQYLPWPLQERRLMSVDLWLIERLPGGAERTQSLTVRGLPHHEIPFYFDAIREGPQSLEIFGSVAVRPEGDTTAVALATNYRWGPAAFDWRKDADVQVRETDAALRVRPGETVEVALRPLNDSVEPFTARQYAIRIRAHQLR